MQASNARRSVAETWLSSHRRIVGRHGVHMIHITPGGGVWPAGKGAGPCGARSPLPAGQRGSLAHAVPGRRRRCCHRSRRPPSRGNPDKRVARWHWRQQQWRWRARQGRGWRSGRGGRSFCSAGGAASVRRAGDSAGVSGALLGPGCVAGRGHLHCLATGPP